jgi:hypothetical protein
VISGADWGIIGLVMSLWLASIAAAWKVASLLASISSELKDLRADTQEAVAQTQRNSQNLIKLEQQLTKAGRASRW